MNATVYAPRDFDFANCDSQGNIGGYKSPGRDYIRAYADILAIVAPSRVFEWGPGQNTDMALAVGANVFSVEQNAGWLHKHNHRLLQYHLDTGDVRYPTLMGHYDCQLHFVDSRKRERCISYILEYCTVKDHVTVLHDAQRKRYWGALGQYDFVLVPFGSTAAATNSVKIRDALMDIWKDGMC